MKEGEWGRKIRLTRVRAGEEEWRRKGRKDWTYGTLQIFALKICRDSMQISVVLECVNIQAGCIRELMQIFEFEKIGTCANFRTRKSL